MLTFPGVFRSKEERQCFDLLNDLSVYTDLKDSLCQHNVIFSTYIQLEILLF